MRSAHLLVISLLLAGCSAHQPPPKAPPAPAQQSQEISRAQSDSLPKLGNITVSVHGSPDDALRAVATQANRAGAAYYQIVMLSETVMPGRWYASAILYSASPTTGARH